MNFRESNIEIFMGGDFQFDEPPKTAAQLKQALQDIIAEIDGWGSDLDDIKLSECIFYRCPKDGGMLRVTLESGITQ